jgi:Predicted Zn-dependent peptidases
MKLVKFNNGFEIYTKENKDAKTVTFSIYAKVGSFNEESHFGIAHFLEHMVFKGTTNRNAAQIIEDVENYGGVVNAETSFNYTRYYVTMPKEYWKKGADVICDILFNSNFPEDEFKLEKKVVQEELKMYNDNPESYVSELLFKEMFKSYPERQTIGGTIDSVESITIQNLIDFKDKFYQPNNMFAVVTGNINTEDVVEFLSFIKDIKNKNESIDINNDFKPDILDSQTVTKRKNIEQSHLIWGLFVAPENNKESYALKVASVILGGNASSRLYRIIREQKGLAYTVSTHYFSMIDCAIIEGYAGLESKSIDEVKEIVVEQFEDLRNNLVSDEELNRAIAYFNGKQAIRLDNLTSINGYVGQSIILGVSTDPEYHLEQIRNVTKQDIQNVAIKYFTPDNWQFAELLPIN